MRTLPINEAKEFLRQWQPIERAARSHILMASQDQLSERERQRTDLSEWNLFTIDEEGVRFVQEYNDSCHCHPEYQKAYVLIGWDDIYQHEWVQVPAPIGTAFTLGRLVPNCS